MHSHEIDRLEDDIVQLSANIAAATYELLVKIRTFDELGAWGGQGFLSAAHWLSFRVGMEPRTAREKVRIAHALGGLPLISDAFSKGALSYSHVRALTRIATPENEDTLLVYAQNATASQLEKLVRKIHHLNNASLPDAERRYFTMDTEDDGMVTLRVRLLPEEAAVLRKALDAATHIPAKGERVDRVSSLVEVAERSLSGGSSERRTDDRYQVVLHLEAQEDTVAHIEDVPVSEACKARILCDASLVTMLHDKEGRILNVGRKSRIVPSHIRRAIMARDKHCVFPGCTHRHVDVHHIKAWQAGGETSLSNGLVLCRAHHAAVHENRFRIEGTGDNLRFVDKHGRVIEKQATPRGQALTMAYETYIASAPIGGIDYGYVVSQFYEAYTKD